MDQTAQNPVPNQNPLLAEPINIEPVVAASPPPPVEGQVVTPGGDNSSNNKKYLTYGLYGLVAIAVLILTYLLLAKFYLNTWPFAEEVAPVPVAQQVVRPSPSPVASPDETTSWKTFTGETMYTTDGSSNFSIKYPSGWILEGNNLYPDGKKDPKTDPVVFLGAGGHGMGSEQPQILYLPVGKAQYWGVEGDNGTLLVIASIQPGINTYIIEGKNLTAEHSKTLLKMLETWTIANPIN